MSNIKWPKTSCQVDLLASWLFGKLTFWQVDILASWPFAKLTPWQVDLLASWHFDGRHFGSWQLLEWRLTLWGLTFWQLTIFLTVSFLHPFEDLFCPPPKKTFFCKNWFSAILFVIDHKQKIDRLLGVYSLNFWRVIFKTFSWNRFWTFLWYYSS
jgi:hypothetical protein